MGCVLLGSFLQAALVIYILMEQMPTETESAHPADHPPLTVWGRHRGYICKPTSTASLAPVKTAGADQQHMKNLICNKIIFFQIHPSTFKGGETRLRIRNPEWRV